MIRTCRGRRRTSAGRGVSTAPTCTWRCETSRPFCATSRAIRTQTMAGPGARSLLLRANRWRALHDGVLVGRRAVGPGVRPHDRTGRR